jgi:hypothetical protein
MFDIGRLSDDYASVRFLVVDTRIDALSSVCLHYNVNIDGGWGSFPSFLLLRGGQECGRADIANGLRVSLLIQANLAEWQS